jgi:hypothetical protein
MAIDFVAYHDRSSQDHQDRFDQLFPQGYRMISLSVYGDRSSPLYAAVWVKRSGPDWSAVHGVDAAGYQAAFDNAAAKGFKPVLLAAAGPTSDPVFAGTFEKTSGPIPLTRFALAPGAPDQSETFLFWMAQAQGRPGRVAGFGGGT